MLFAEMPERTSFGFRLFCGLLVVALIALSVGGVAAFLSHGASAAAAWTSLSKAALLVSMSVGTTAFAMVVGAWVLARRRGDPASLKDLALWLGLVVCGLSATAVVAVIPVSASSVVPDLVRLGAFAGLGLIGLWLSLEVIGGVTRSAGEGDWFRVAAMVICVALLGVFVWVRFF